jgi:hypothetical protein
MAAGRKVTIKSLNSWKEISAYMDRGVRTVQRWERELALPVHRVGKGPRSPVHAFPPELDAWLFHAGRNDAVRDGLAAKFGIKARLHPDGTSAVSRVLVRRSSDLVHELVQTIAQQHQRTEELLSSFQKIRSQLQTNMRQQKKDMRKLQASAKERGGTTNKPPKLI